jgi:CRP-like cAMP-binding protein
MRIWETPREIRDCEVLFHSAEPATHAYFLERGAVEIRHDTDSGLGVVVKVLAAPNLFGVIEQLGNEPVYLETVRVLGGARIVAVPREPFRELMRRSPEWCFACLENTATAFCMAARFEPGQFATTERKLANYLLALFDVAGETRDGRTRLTIKRTQTDFAGWGVGFVQATTMGSGSYVGPTV